ncbi:hypothetical protein C8A05DRAFT_36676 [Staphylotrichum tortipilum]|uniref:Uncharacterized protein n=1 Tax=Staphylotrichum tortipilum TaxID=2831512 RepID=A0AAN6MF90_9PEZI|nr:hypothetical protein C8A05DRAFT_36676 [Staphylotrichum longicolle]
MSVAEALEKCSRVYSDTFHRSEVALDKLSSRAKELSMGLGSGGMLGMRMQIGHLLNQLRNIHERTYAEIVQDQSHISRDFHSIKQEATTLRDHWHDLQDFLQDLQTAVGRRKRDAAAMGNGGVLRKDQMSREMEEIRAEITRLKKSSAEALGPVNPWVFIFFGCFLAFGLLPFGYAVTLTIAMSLAFYMTQSQSGAVPAGTTPSSNSTSTEIKAHIQSLESQLQRANRELSALEKQKHSQTAIGSAIGSLQPPLSSAFQTVSSAYTAYTQLLERIHDIENSRYMRLNRAIDVIKESLMNKTYTHGDNLVAPHVRVSREIFLPALHEVCAFGSFATVLSNTNLNINAGRFKLQVQQHAQMLPQPQDSHFDLSTITPPVRPPATVRANNRGLPSVGGPAPTTTTPTPPSALGKALPPRSERLGYLNQVGSFAEEKVNKMYNEAHQDAIGRVRARVEDTYTSTMHTTTRQFLATSSSIDHDVYLPGPHPGPQRLALPPAPMPYAPHHAHQHPQQYSQQHQHQYAGQ